YAAVSVIYSGGRYKVTSGTTGAGSKVRIRDACDYDGINWGDLVMRLKLCTEFSDEAEHEWSDHELDEYRGDYYDGTGAATSKSVFYGDSSYGLHTSAEQPSICITGQGYHVGGANPATSLSSSSTTKFKITCDACTTPHIITLANYPRTTGVLVASEMQSKIQALGTCAHAGIFTKVQVKYENGRYKIFSGTIGAASNIRITAGDDHDVSAVLKIGVANGGEEFDGSATEKNEFSLVADAEAATTVTLTLYQPFTNDPASGSNITLNMVDTSMFALNDVVIVSSSAGSEYATVNLITDNVSIRVASLSLNHTLTNPCVYWGFYGAQIARNMQKYIRAIGAAYDAITVVYSNGKYIITSETSGTLSKIHITSDPSNDIADRLKIGTANGGVDTDGTGPSWTQNACVITQNGVILIPLFGPLLIWSAYLEINVTALTGSPKACFWVDENVGLETLSNEITLGYNKLWFPDTQGYGTIYLGIRCPEGSSITLYDMNFVVRRDLSQEELEFIEPADTGAISLVAGGSAKFSKCEAYFRDAYWS
ncbi:MAG: hypothetical protein O8C67_15745, partial [Candidatus Methanoperedens sp.]|nr:hypothetical protein [Candidatus Methanoperedens sp.]